MRDDRNIQELVDKALQSLDQVERARANPFLYTRVQARLEALHSPWEQTLGFITRPVVAIALVILVLLANAWIVYQGSPAPDPSSSVATTANSEETEGYGLAVNTFYDYEIPER